MSWYLAVLKKYAQFSGRARRKEYWMFVLFNLIITVVLAFLDGLLGTFIDDAGIGILGGIYGLAVLLPGLAVAIRRLHDGGRSGWWYLLVLIPFIGGIWLLILLVKDGESGANQYGPNPKADAV